MQVFMNCTIKKKMGRCYYELLVQLDREIERLKKAKIYVDKKYTEMIIQLEQHTQLPLYAEPICYLDGFIWQDEQAHLGICSYLEEIIQKNSDKSEQPCRFKMNNCETLVLAKKSLKGYLNRHLIEKIEIYNNALQLYETVWHYANQHERKERTFVRFSFLESEHRACYCEMNFELLNDGATQAMVYFEKDKRQNTYQMHPLFINKRRECSSLQHIGEPYIENSALLIELCYLESWIDQRDSFKLECLVEYLKTSKSIASKTISFYGDLTPLSPKDKSICIKYFRQNGFKILGYYKEAHYIEECLVYWCLNL